MDREIPSVPITTLAGVASLTDLLPEMPLPTPLPQTLSNKSLLFHPRVAEEAQNLLGVRDETLVPQLVHSLIQTSAHHIEVKDHYAGTDAPVDQHEDIPELLRAMIASNPNVFYGTAAESIPTTAASLAVHHHQHLPISATIPSSLHTTTATPTMPTMVNKPLSSTAIPSLCPQSVTNTATQQLLHQQSQPQPPLSATVSFIPAAAAATCLPATGEKLQPTQSIHHNHHQLQSQQSMTPTPMMTANTTTMTPATIIHNHTAPAAVISPPVGLVLPRPRPTVITDPKCNVDMNRLDDTRIPVMAPVTSMLISPPVLPTGTPSTGGITEQLRQLRRQQRVVSSGASPAQASDAPNTANNSRIPTLAPSVTTPQQAQIIPISSFVQPPTETIDSPRTLRSRSDSAGQQLLTVKDEPHHQMSTILQPVVRLQRISVEDQLLMQRSLADFVENKPKLAQELGILKNECEDESDNETDSRDKRKLKCNESDDDEYVGDDDRFSALVGTKRRKRTERPETVVVKPKLRRVEASFIPVIEKLSIDDLMESNTYDRFNKNVDHVLKFCASLDVSEIGEDGMVPDEHLLSRHVLQELVVEAAKLKILGAMEMIPVDKIIKLLNALEMTVRGADRVSPITDEDNEAMRQIWIETAMERVLAAADASLICMHILTAPNMPKRVYIEDVIEKVLLYVKYQMINTIFPSYDATYRLDNKRKDGRRKKTAQVLERSVKSLYTKICELVSLVAELLNIQVLTDTSVLHGSSMGVSPFFTENVSELQLSCLKLVTTIFTRYEKHRRILLDDILASIARLPSTKRSLRTYKINGDEHIQMLTALVLQLIQCIVALPENLFGNSRANHRAAVAQATAAQQNDNVKNVDKDVLICNKYREAITTAGTFLSVFLSKCGSKAEEIDYRPLFENFVQDLLSTVNKPEWPATELLLSLLGKLLVSNFSNRGTDMSLRVASLDYLGVVSARLRRDSVMSRFKLDTIDQMIKDIKQEEMKESEGEVSSKKKHFLIKNDEERIQFLQRVLLDFLAMNSQNDEAFKFARHFYIAQWYKECNYEKSGMSESKGNRNKSPRSDNHRSKRNDKNLHEDSDESDDDLEEKIDKSKENDLAHAEMMRVLEERKKFLIAQIKPFRETTSTGGTRVKVFQTYIDYSSAELIAQYLASKRYFSQCFDQYLRAILSVLKESSIAIRTKAMKCLTMIVEADPSVLGRHDMQMGVNLSFLDHSTSVREAAVDLVGKFVLSRPELIDKYYEMLSARILDTGVSVRKRVIKILKDICIECPDFGKIPEICVKMIRRVNDEEGIRKLVMEVFQNMWFTPIKDASLLRKVMHITDVVASSKEIGLEWFEQLLVSLFKPREDKEDSTRIHTEPPKALLLACKQIVDCLIENVLRLEETNSSGSSQRLVACLTTLHLFAKIRPQLLVWHASTLQPYLSLKCQSAGDIQIISSVARMLELVVPLMEHPSDSFLAQLEEDSMKLILQHDRPIVASCISCLGSIVNNVTRNFKLIRDCFKKYYDYLDRFKTWLQAEPQDARVTDTQYRKYFRRALFTVGLLLRHFDFKDKDVIGDLPAGIKDQVFGTFSYFLQQADDDIQANTLKAIGSICIRHYEFMLEDDLKTFYHRMLTGETVPLKMKSEVLINIESYLMEEEKRMIKQDLEWAKRSKQENLKEMGDVSSGMASTVIQLYLKEILHSYLHCDLLVRQPALKVIQLILQQGLVHPVQIVPYLICMSTDCEKVVSHSADKQLLEIEKKYPGFIHTKSSLGIRLSYELQRILQQEDSTSLVRGSRIKEAGEYPAALNGYLYSILRSSRQQRRALVLNILKQFDEQVRTSLSYMLYLADNLAYFPYMVQDEPLFIVHHIDIMISVSGTNLLQSFREGLILTEAQQTAIQAAGGQIDGNTISALDEDDEDEVILADRVPPDASQLQACITAAQGCLLLLVLKQHIKDSYGLSDGKMQQYSPSEAAKVYEKATTRRSNSLFTPKGTVNRIKLGTPPENLDFDGRKDLIRQYLDFKQLMLQLDPDDAEEEEGGAAKPAVPGGNTLPSPGVVNIAGALAVIVPSTETTTASILTQDDQLALNNYKDKTPPKVPKLVISNRRLDGVVSGSVGSVPPPSDAHKHRSTSRKHLDKPKKHRHKKKRRKFVSSSGDESENDCSDPDFMA